MVYGNCSESLCAVVVVMLLTIVERNRLSRTKQTEPTATLLKHTAHQSKLCIRATVYLCLKFVLRPQIHPCILKSIDNILFVSL